MKYRYYEWSEYRMIIHCFSLIQALEGIWLNYQAIDLRWENRGTPHAMQNSVGVECWGVFYTNIQMNAK